MELVSGLVLASTQTGPQRCCAWQPAAAPGEHGATASASATAQPCWHASYTEGAARSGSLPRNQHIKSGYLK